MLCSSQYSFLFYAISNYLPSSSFLPCSVQVLVNGEVICSFLCEWNTGRKKTTLLSSVNAMLWFNGRREKGSLFVCSELFRSFHFYSLISCTIKLILCPHAEGEAREIRVIHLAREMWREKEKSLLHVVSYSKSDIFMLKMKASSIDFINLEASNGTNGVYIRGGFVRVSVPISASCLYILQVGK